MSSFFGKKKTSTTSSKKKVNDEYSFTLNDINVAKIDKDFNMNSINNISNNKSGSDDLIFDIDEGTSLEQLGISSLSHQPTTTIIPKEKTKLHTFVTMNQHLENKKLPIKTDIPCFGCHRKFDTVPLGVPIEYHPSVYISKSDPTKTKKITISEREKLNKEDQENTILQKEYFDVDGIVCSFNCILSIIENNDSPLYKNTEILIPKLYKMIFGEYPDTKIIKAPSWKLRTQYGGTLTDHEFVCNLQTIKYTDTDQIKKANRLMNPVGRIFKVEEIDR
jgi:hypothetical protein